MTGTLRERAHHFPREISLQNGTLLKRDRAEVEQRPPRFLPIRLIGRYRRAECHEHGRRQQARRLPKILVARKREDRAPEAVVRRGNHRHLGPPRHYLKALLDFHQLTRPGNVPLGKNAYQLTRGQRLHRAANGLRRVLRGDRNHAAHAKHPVEKPIFAQALVADEPQRSRARQLHHDPVGVGEMIRDEQCPTRRGDVLRATRAHAIEQPRDEGRNDLEPQRKKRAPAKNRGGHERGKVMRID